jgi:hypothetical protein
VHWCLGRTLSTGILAPVVVIAVVATAAVVRISAGVASAVAQYTEYKRVMIDELWLSQACCLLNQTVCSYACQLAVQCEHSCLYSLRYSAQAASETICVHYVKPTLT